jgi:phage gpG-like protein
MALDLIFTIDIPESLRRRLEPRVLQGAIVKGMQRAVLSVVRRAKLNLTGRFLRVQRGRLRSSVTSTVLIAGDEIIGQVGTNVFYGRIHEEGVPHPWTIRPRTAKRLAWRAGGKWVTAMEVTHPPLRRRPWLRTAALESQGEVRAFFQAEVNRALGNG